MPRYVDVDALWRDITSNIEDCGDVLEIIERQPTIDHIAEDSKKVVSSWGHENGLISRRDAIEYLMTNMGWCDENGYMADDDEKRDVITDLINGVPSAQPDVTKYEYHYDHTDCIWYRPEARNRCPTTCAQYRDGWNDAMNYIFRDGKGYRPYRRDKQYGE